MRLSARYEHSLKYTKLPKTKPGVWRFSHSIGEMPLAKSSPEAEEEWDQGSLPNTPERKSRISACKSLPSFSSCSSIFANRFADYESDSDSDDGIAPAPGSAAAAMYAARADCAVGDGAAEVDDEGAEKTRSLDEFSSPLIRRKCKSFSSFMEAANGDPDQAVKTPPRLEKAYAAATASVEETPPSHVRGTAQSGEKSQQLQSVRRSISFAMDEEDGSGSAVSPPEMAQGNTLLLNPPSRSTSRSGLYGIRNGHTASVEIMSGPVGSVSTTSMFDEPRVVKTIVDLALTKLRAALSLYSMESLYFTTATEFTSNDLMSMAAQHFGTSDAADAPFAAPPPLQMPPDPFAGGSGSADGGASSEGDGDGEGNNGSDSKLTISSVAEWLQHHNATNPLVANPIKARESELVTGHSSFLMRRRVVHIKYEEGAVGFGFGFTTCVMPEYPWTRVHRVTPRPEGALATLMPGDVLVQVNGVDVLNNGPRFIGKQLANSPPMLMLLVARSPDNESAGMYVTTTPASLQTIGAVDEEIKGLYQVAPNDGAENTVRQIMKGIERAYTRPVSNPAFAWLSEQNEAIFSLLDSMSGTLMETENVISEWDKQEENHRYGPHTCSSVHSFAGIA